MPYIPCKVLFARSSRKSRPRPSTDAPCSARLCASRCLNRVAARTAARFFLRTFAAQALLCSPLCHRRRHSFPLTMRCAAMAAAVHSARFYGGGEGRGRSGSGGEVGVLLLLWLSCPSYSWFKVSSSQIKRSCEKWRYATSALERNRGLETS